MYGSRDISSGIRLVYLKNAKFILGECLLAFHLYKTSTSSSSTPALEKLVPRFEQTGKVYCNRLCKEKQLERKKHGW